VTDDGESVRGGAAAPAAGLRIGELSRRVGVSTAALRAWERRYGVLRPQRSRSGQRLYTKADEARIREMLRQMARGYSAAVAARLATEAPAALEPPAAPSAAPPAPAAPGGPTAPPALPAPGAPPAEPLPGDLAALAADLRAALHHLDEARAEAAFDRLLAGFALDTVLRDAVLPFLRDLGDCWARGTLTVAHEHFATAVIAGRLHALARGWDAGVGPRAVLACPSGERHELGLLCFALAMRGRGWRVCYLGADTPIGAISAVAGELDPDLVVLGAVRAEALVDVADEVRGLSGTWRTCLGGRGAAPALAARVGAQALPDDPIAAADLVSGAHSA